MIADGHNNSITHKYPTLLVSPKHGGILQSSGFLDLRSLMALNRTAKVNALDRSSLILFIEHEITTYYHIRDREHPLTLLKYIYSRPLLKQWLERDHTTAQSIPIRDMLSEGAVYDVMLKKMFRLIPPSQRVQTIEMRDEFGRTVLHCAAAALNPESIRYILALLSDSQYLHATKALDQIEKNVLHHAAGSYERSLGWFTEFQSSRAQSIKTILNGLPESERMKIGSTCDWCGVTALHDASRMGDLHSVKELLAIYPKSQHSQMVNMQDQTGRTVLDYALRSFSLELVQFFVRLLPEWQYLQAVVMQDTEGQTPLHYAVQRGQHDYVLALLNSLPESQRLRVVSIQDGNGNHAFHYTTHYGRIDTSRVILALYPEAQHLQVICMQDRKGETVFHRACSLGETQYFQTIFSLLPEALRLHVGTMVDGEGRTLLHCAARSGRIDSVKTILSLYSELQLSQDKHLPDRTGATILHYAAESVNYETIMYILNLWSESHRPHALTTLLDRHGRSVLHWVAFIKPEMMSHVLNLVPESQRLQAVMMQDQDGATVLDHAAQSFRSEFLIKTILASLPESQRLQVVSVPDCHGRMVCHAAAHQLLPKNSGDERNTNHKDQKNQKGTSWGINPLVSFLLRVAIAITIISTLSLLESR